MNDIIVQHIAAYENVQLYDSFYSSKGDPSKHLNGMTKVASLLLDNSNGYREIYSIYIVK